MAKKEESKAVSAKKAAPKKPSIFKRLGKYFRDTRGEFKKVVWPSKKQVINNTVVVLVMCAVFGVVVWGLDALLALLRNTILGLF